MNDAQLNNERCDPPIRIAGIHRIETFVKDVSHLQEVWRPKENCANNLVHTTVNILSIIDTDNATLPMSYIRQNYQNFLSISDSWLLIKNDIGTDYRYT